MKDTKSNKNMQPSKIVEECSSSAILEQRSREGGK